MILYANVIPKQLTKIPWPWKNETRDGKTFVSWSPGKIEMPSLLEHFDWNTYTIEDMAAGRDFGTRNFKSIFTTAARFMGYEKLLIEMPRLNSIMNGFLLWNEALLQRWYGNMEWFHLADDFAGNNGLFLSPEDWEGWLIPYYVCMVDFAHDNNLKVIFHSDGDIYNILESLKGIGVDFLDYQPIGAMASLVRRKTWGDINLIINEKDEQNRTNDETMRLQRGEEK